MYSYFLTRRMNLCNSEVASQLRMKLRFFRTHYRIWMIILAFSTLLLSFAVNILVDNTDGHYVIYSPSTYALIYSVLFVFLYAMLEAAHVPVTGDLRAYLWDLERQVLEETARIEKNYRVRFFLAIAVLLVITSLMIYVILRQLAAM